MESIKYRVNKESINESAKELTAKVCLYKLIAPILFFIAGIICLTIGVVNKGTGLEIYGIVVIIVGIFLLVRFISAQMAMKQGVEGNFSIENKDGFVEYELLCNDDEYEIKNLTANTNEKFKREEILTVKKTKNNIFVFLQGYTYIPLPALPEIIKEFASCDYKHRAKNR